MVFGTYGLYIFVCCCYFKYEYSNVSTTEQCFFAENGMKLAANKQNIKRCAHLEFRICKRY